MWLPIRLGQDVLNVLMRRMSWIVTVLVCFAANVAIGRAIGYTITSSYLAFWLAAALTAAAAWRLARRFCDSTAVSDVVVYASVLAAAIVVLCAMMTAALGHFTVRTVLLGHGVIFAATLWPALRPRDGLDLQTGARQLGPAVALAVGAAMLAFAGAYAVWHAPLTLYDSLSYHLYFAARWVQDHQIGIIPTPFSDVAQAYAPGNGELFFAWLMLPFNGDLLARAGQLPFALLGALCLYCIGRRLGCRESHAVYPAVFFLLSRPVAEQMVGANVDLICAAGFLASIYFVMAAAERDRTADWLLFGVSAGLYLGTKYVALVYVPVLLLLVFARGPRRRSLWALPGIAVFGAPWYLRNWVVAGSPIYPASLTLGGVTVAHGAFTRAAMFNTIFHTANPGLFPAMAAHALGPALFVVWLPCAIAGWAVMFRRGWWPYGAMALTPLLMVPLYWFAFPVNIDSRFLMPAVGPSLLPLAFLFSRDRRWNAGVHLFYTIAMVWLLVGMRASLPGTLPWFMNGWLALDGLVPPAFVPVFAALAMVMAAAWLAVRRHPQLAVPVFVSAIVCSTTAMAIGAERWCGASACDYLETTSPFIRTGYTDSWHWIGGNIAGATIAYSGINLPYPLTGARLANRVVYVNIDGRSRWRFHDYDRAYRTGRLVQSPPMLATSSGELMPVADRTGPREDAIRPRYERMHGDRDAWVFNLESMGVRYLFVAMLSAYEVDYVWHTERGFPIEDEWAESDPQRFHIVYQNPQVHIYSIDSGKGVAG
jgi:hypothetical protein